MKIDQANAFREQYCSATPFPHIVFKNFWKSEELEKVAVECEDFSNWDKSLSSPGVLGKRCCSSIEQMPVSTRALIHDCSSPKFLRFLEAITGEKGLVPDPYLVGGGIHSTLSGGFLKMHADFNWHEGLRLYRRLNLLIYLNKHWESDWGGDLLLARMVDGVMSVESKISPILNTMVLFETTDESYHGHPFPLACPKSKARNSIALYYYVSQKPSCVKREECVKTLYKMHKDF